MILSKFYNQNKDILDKIIYIIKILDRKYLYKLLLLFISFIFGAIIELLFLVSLSIFLRVILNNGIIDKDNITNQGFEYFYFNLLNLFENHTESLILGNCILFILISLLTLCIRLLSLRINILETAKIGAFIEAKCGESLLKVPYKFYKDLNISILLTDFNNIPKFVNDFFQSGMQSISSLLIILFLTIYLKSRSDSLFIFAFLFLSIIYIFTLLINIKTLKSLSKKTKKLKNEKTSIVNFIVRMFRHILLEQKEGQTKLQFGSIVYSIYKNNARGSVISSYPKIIIEYAAIISVAILLIVQTIIYGPSKSIETVGIFLVAVLRVLPSLQQIYVFLVKLTKRKFVIESVYELLNLPARDKKNWLSKKHSNSLKIINSIQLKNISFKYTNKGRFIINNFSYEFVSGKSYAIVGKSGSGKSTLIDIILNLLSTESGEITLNKKYKLSNESNTSFIRSNTLLIGQNDFYCGDKIKDFLEISPEDENNHVFLEKLKDGINNLEINDIFHNKFIDSYIGENGSKISGGQRQRVILLKAILSKKSILIFDEVLSSLDQATMNFVIKFLLGPKVFTENRILIFATHSKEVAKACDEIIRI